MSLDVERVERRAQAALAIECKPQHSMGWGSGGDSEVKSVASKASVIKKTE